MHHYSVFKKIQRLYVQYPFSQLSFSHWLTFLWDLTLFFFWDLIFQGLCALKLLEQLMASSTVDIWYLWNWVLRFSVEYFTIPIMQALLPRSRQNHALHLPFSHSRFPIPIPFPSPIILVGGKGKEEETQADLNPTGADITSSLQRNIPCSNLSTRIGRGSSRKWLASPGTILPQKNEQ